MIPKQQVKERLKKTETALDAARDKRTALARQHATARATGEDVKEISKGMRALDGEIETLQNTQIEQLRVLGEGAAAPSGDRPQDGRAPAENGWAVAARELDPKNGRTRVEVDAGSLMGTPMASLTVTPGGGLDSPPIQAPFMQQAADRRFLYPAFPHVDIDPATMAITEYRQVGGRTVTGSVERDPIATTEKASVDLQIELVTPKVKQFATFVDGVPMKLFDIENVMRSFLESELKYQIQVAFDAHVLAQITAATPAHGKTGTALIDRARNAVAAMRALGANPTILAVTPAEAAALDVLVTTGSGDYVFATRDTGSASPLWGMSILELPHIVKPTLIDPAMLGIRYDALGTILVDPYTGLSTNEVRLRVEIDMLFHVRDVAGAYVIE